MHLFFDPCSSADYAAFIRAKSMPSYKITGHTAYIPDEYASHFHGTKRDRLPVKYDPSPWLFDYQSAIARLAIRKKKFAVFAACGAGKTFIFLEFAKYVSKVLGKRKNVLIVSPLMVIKQTLEECRKFYGDDLNVQQIAANDLADWTKNGTGIGITNYEAIHEGIPQGKLGCLILEESSLLKGQYGTWGQECIRLGKGLEYKLALTGTPAPNDRIEYGNHAVFLDAFPTLNSFYARYFVNRGQTDNRWEMKPHALLPFYRSLSHWCIFLENPATYGWKDNTDPLPPINVHIHDVELTQEQQELAYDTTQSLFAHVVGGIGSRSVLSQIAKGSHKGIDVETRKPAYIRSLVDSWPDESTIIWCWFNREQEILEKEFPEAASIHGGTPLADRETLVNDFKSGKRRVLISKPKVLGYGLNLQVCTRMVFSGLQDSFESYWQCIKRANRYGSTRPLNVHIPITDIERPMIETVLKKAKRVQEDTETQERIFRDARLSV